MELGLTSDAKLKQHLLRREGPPWREGPDGEAEDGVFIRVNFDPALVCLLREVKYFKLLNDTRTETLKFIEIPDSALQIYSKVETFRQQTGNLELIVNTYNNIIATLIDVERPLVQAKLDSIDKVLIKGLKHLNWKSHNIDDFVKTVMREVKDAHSTLQTCKSRGTGSCSGELCARSALSSVKFDKSRSVAWRGARGTTSTRGLMICTKRLKL